MGDPAVKELTPADAAKLVKRLVPVLEDGKPTGKEKEVPVKAEEVLAFAIRGDSIVVVTKDGQKLTGAL